MLSHIRNSLSAQSTRALLCLGVWSKMGYIRDSDVKAITMLDDLAEGEEEPELQVGWDRINV